MHTESQKSSCEQESLSIGTDVAQLKARYFKQINRNWGQHVNGHQYKYTSFEYIEKPRKK